MNEKRVDKKAPCTAVGLRGTLTCDLKGDHGRHHDPVRDIYWAHPEGPYMRPMRSKPDSWKKS